MPTSVELFGVARASSSKRSIVTLLVSVGSGVLLGAICAVPIYSVAHARSVSEVLRHFATRVSSPE
jgi:hypothetical protein